MAATARLVLLVIGIAVAAASCAKSDSALDETCIAPANPGGGWDFTCRTTARVLATLDSGRPKMTVLNIPGEGGAAAFKHVAENLRSDGRVIVAASPSTLLGIAHRHYGSFSENDVRWIAALAYEPSVVAVAKNSPWHSLRELIEAWRANPVQIISGGASVLGGQDHIKILQLAQAANVTLSDVNYRPLGGPTEALAALERGEIQVFPGDISEVRSYVESGRIRILAVLAEQRVTGSLASIPTAREQGFDVSWEIWRGFYAPPDISESSYRTWIDDLREVSRSAEWLKLLEENGLTPRHIDGPEFERFVKQQIVTYRTVLQAVGLDSL